jgi:hypothetical protein
MDLTDLDTLRPTPAFTCKTAERPKLEIEETELNFLNAVTWFPAKESGNQSMSRTTTWRTPPCKVCSTGWPRSTTSMDPVNLTMSEKAGWAGTGLLTMLTVAVLRLRLAAGVYVADSRSASATRLCDSDFCTVELTLKYSEVQYRNLCGGGSPIACCRGC